MKWNAAARLPFDDQIDGNPMEARIATLETHVAHIKEDVAEMRKDIGEMRRDISDLKSGQADLKGDLASLRQEVKAAVSGLEVKMIRSMIATVIACGGLAFSAARLIH
jgi:outer membrane murein-binding lipoprotein Lpp